jgi:hypothetical protein
MGYQTTVEVHEDGSTSATTTNDRDPSIVYATVTVARPTDRFERNAVVITTGADDEQAFLDQTGSGTLRDDVGRALAVALGTLYGYLPTDGTDQPAPPA